MKKVMSFLLVFVLLLFPACNDTIDLGIIGGADGPTGIFVSSGTGKEKPEQGIIRIIRINGEYYYDTQTECTLGPRCGVMDGSVSSDPAPMFPYELPQKDNESNFGVIEKTYGYQIGAENTIELLEDGKWRVFKKIITDKDLSTYRYVYTLSGILPDAETESEWLIFSDLLDLDFAQVQSTLGDFDSGETKTFYYMKIK